VIVSRKTHDAIQTALHTVSTRAVTQWCHGNLGITMRAQRTYAFAANKNRICNSLAA
jgi:hypothetical protein